MISAEMIAPLLEQLTAQAELAQAMGTQWQEGSGAWRYYDGRSGGFTDAVVLVSTWAAGVQS